MVNFLVTLENGEKKLFENFEDDEGMGCFYNDEGTLFCIEYSNSTIFTQTEDGTENETKFAHIQVIK